MMAGDVPYDGPKMPCIVGIFEGDGLDKLRHRLLLYRDLCSDDTEHAVMTAKTETAG